MTWTSRPHRLNYAPCVGKFKLGQRLIPHLLDDWGGLGRVQEGGEAVGIHVR